MLASQKIAKKFDLDDNYRLVINMVQSRADSIPHPHSPPEENLLAGYPLRLIKEAPISSAKTIMPIRPKILRYFVMLFYHPSNNFNYKS